MIHESASGYRLAELVTTDVPRAGVRAVHSLMVDKSVLLKRITAKRWYLLRLLLIPLSDAACWYQPRIDPGADFRLTQLQL